MKKRINYTQTMKIIRVVILISLISHLSKNIIVSAQTQTKFAMVNGITIAYERFGNPENETILLIAGSGAQLTMWPYEFCEMLALKGYHVVRFDNRDVGLSSKFDNSNLWDWLAIAEALAEKSIPPIPYSLDDMAGDAASLLDAIEVDKAHIVGISMGGMIAQRVAYLYPEHTHSLVSIMSGGASGNFPLIADTSVVNEIPPPGLPGDTLTYLNRELQSAKILAGSVYPPDEEVLKTRIKIDIERSFDPYSYIRQGVVATAGFMEDRREYLNSIEVPTLIIHGDNDPMVALEAGIEVANNIPEAELRIINGLGHYLPEALINIIIDMIIENANRDIK